MEIDNTLLEEVSSEGCEAPAKGRKLLLAFALLMFAAAYVFVGLVPIYESPLGFLVLTVVFWAVTAVFCVLNGGKFCLHSVCAVLFGVAAALFRFFRGHVAADVFPVMLLCALAYAYFVVSMFGNHSKSFGGGFLLDIVKGLGYLFVSFSAFFKTLMPSKAGKRESRGFWMTVIGITAAVIIVLIVGSLLSYDANFAKLIPDIEIDSIGEIFVKLHIAVPLAAMLFGLYFSSMHNKLERLSSPETVKSTGEKLKVIPAIIVILPVFALLAVYVLFFVSQFAYYLSAFTHTLPEGYSAAEYAREGFFQLCGVVCINGVLLAVLRCLTKISSKSSENLCRILTFLLSLFTLILIATAISKMLLYIERYDLTRLRLAVTVFMLFLAVAFTVTLLSAFMERLKAMPVIIVSGAVILAVFALINTNSFIAKYNTDAYLSGRHESIDIEYLTNDLGYSAVPELIRLRDNVRDAAAAKKAAEGVNEYKARIMDTDMRWYNYSIPYLKAKRLLTESPASVHND